MEDMNKIIQWIQFAVTIIGLIAIFIQIGSKYGKQEEKNKNVEKTQEIQRKEISAIKDDISTIREDIGLIKGTLSKKVIKI